MNEYIDSTVTVDAKGKHDPKQYMRDYRAAGRDLASKVQTKTRAKALTWVRSNHPDVWSSFLEESRREVMGHVAD